MNLREVEKEIDDGRRALQQIGLLLSKLEVVALHHEVALNCIAEIRDIAHQKGIAKIVDMAEQAIRECE